MKTKVRILLAGLLLAVICWGVWRTLPDPAPLFHGKPESAWIREINCGAGEGQTQRWREFGPDGVRVLIRGLEKEKAKQPWQKLYRKVHGQLAPRLPFGLAQWLPTPVHQDLGTCMHLVFLLGQLGKDARLATPVMAQALKEDDPFVRFNAIYFFAARSESGNALLNELDAGQKRKILPDFILAMQDSRDLHVRSVAANALQFYTEQADVVAPVLVKACQDAVPQVRFHAAVALNRIDEEAARRAGAVRAVISMLKAPPEIGIGLAQMAAERLRDFRGQPEIAVPALIEALQNTNGLVARMAVESLETAFKDQADIIIPALRLAAQRNDVVAWRATEALKRLESKAPVVRPERP